MKDYGLLRTPNVPRRYAGYVLRSEAGAVALFTGHVREWTDGVRTLYLAYEAYVPMAEKMLAQTGSEIGAKWPETWTAIVRRFGGAADWRNRSCDRHVFFRTIRTPARPTNIPLNGFGNRSQSEKKKSGKAAHNSGWRSAQEAGCCGHNREIKEMRMQHDYGVLFCRLA